jgi:hypothetical protein
MVVNPWDTPTYIMFAREVVSREDSDNLDKSKKERPMTKT